MSSNNGILFNGVLRPKLLHIPFVLCSLITFDFLRPHTALHTAHFDDSIVLPLFVFNTFGSTFSVFSFLHFKQYGNTFYNDLCLIYEKFRIDFFPNHFILDFCFKNLNFLATQLAHFHAFLTVLFVIITFFKPKLSVCFLQLNE